MTTYTDTLAGELRTAAEKTHTNRGIHTATGDLTRKLIRVGRRDLADRLEAADSLESFRGLCLTVADEVGK